MAIPLVSVEEILTHPSPLTLGRAANGEDEGWDGCCPCCLIHGEGFEVKVHCWRGNKCKEGCRWSGVHVSGTLDKTTKLKIAECVRDTNGWTNRTEWDIVIT